MLRRCCRVRALRAPDPQIPRSQSFGRNLALVYQQACTYQLPTSPHLASEGPGGALNKLKQELCSQEFKECFSFPRISSNEAWSKPGTEILVSGYIGRTRKISKELAFANLERNGEKIGQICAKGCDDSGVLSKIRPYSAVIVSGVVTDASSTARFDIDMKWIKYLNPFPKDIIIGRDTVFPPQQRHLQIRFHGELRERLRFRALLKSALGHAMMERDFMDVETPILFKSTSEGAREFIVPTRRPNHAYALPQSPQQYKQALMASGITGYYQFARCFRDEDHRADRQPEFTQLDMEKSFVTGKTIMEDVEHVVRQAWESMREQYVMEVEENSFAPARKASLLDWKQRVQDNAKGDSKAPIYQEYPAISMPFPTVKYADCMDMYGSDKPDLRIPGKIYRVDEKNLSDHFIALLTNRYLQSPIIETWKLPIRQDNEPRKMRKVQKLVRNFMQTLPNSHLQSLDGPPTIFIFDSKRPRSGFEHLDPEGLNCILPFLPKDSGFSDMDDGDIVVFQARKNLPHRGGSTLLGEIRIALYRAAVEAGLVDRDDSFKFLWVTDFPMFTPENESDVGQGGTAGFLATHHPFTAPKSVKDFELLFEDPLKAKADHYDLVLNGVELGGGSRRIHIAAIQRFIFEHILKMSQDKISEFSHLLEALRCGCPPHAGFAIGFDRLAAVWSGASSVRDVIAFPKNNNGVDEFAGGPERITELQMATYGLQVFSPEVPS